MLGLDQQLSVVKDLPGPEGRWELVEMIGEGNYGEVYKAKNVQTGEMAAIKVMEVVVDKEEDIKAELNIFNNHSHHPNIVDFYGAFVKKNHLIDNHLWIAMEYCPFGSVTDLSKSVKTRGGKLLEDIIAYILREVLAGLSYLHASCVLHRDVKGQNVLLTRTARVKLIDFGISAVVSSPTGRRRTAIGTPYWMAPEVIACESQLDCDYDARSDIWSLGITAIEVADSTPPLFGEHPMRALFKIPKHSPPTLVNPGQWSKCFNNFISLCLTKDYEKRPTAHNLFLHTFIHNVPTDPRSIRRRLVSLMETQRLEETALTNSSTSTCVLDTAQKNVKELRTLDTVSDLASLEYINENVIVSQLWKRYQKQQVYTYVGDILISINPFQKLSIYNEKYSQLYCHASRSHIPPHIFAVANSAYQSMVHERRHQCCVVSGESGAGKTEASNILVQQFMRLGLAETPALEEKILKINPLMESFGNARTVINNNSSRFGKYLELHFTPGGHVVGAHVSEYLLEKSRVISQARRERNFHIFYYMLSGLAARKQLGKYRLRSGQYHRYLEHRGTHRGNMKQDAIYSERFDQIEQAFNLFGFSKNEISSIISILAAILNIGDIRLAGETHPHIGEISVVTNTDKINDVASLLQIKAESFQNAITTSRVVTYGEVIVKRNTPEKAMDARDAISKTLYGRLFSWIVNRINPTLNQDTSESNVLHIGILDIFGFENFRRNSFEQLCINVANEQLQFYFNQHVFAWEQEEYEREGINVASVDYHDNRPLLDLLLSRPMGLLSLLDEESKFPRSTDLSLAAKFHGNFESSPYYSRPKDGGPTFTVHHYAGSVTYETANFLDKNRDTLKPDVASLLQKSASSVVRSLFFTPLSRTGSLSVRGAGRMVPNTNPPSATPLFNRRAPHVRTRQTRQSQRAHPGHTPLSTSDTVTAKLSQTVSTYFINSLRELMSKMLVAKPHFVRCIRPNEMKSPDLFQPEKVLIQLRYTGVLETTRIRKEGFSHRIPFSDFIQRYKVVCFQLTQQVSITPANCALILKEAKLENSIVGKTKVFLKYFHSERLLQILSSYEKSATILQSVVRGWIGRKRAKVMRQERDHRAAVKIQACVRKFLVRCEYLKTVARREQAAVKIQTVFRSWRLRSLYLHHLHKRQVAAIRIQSAVRMWMCCSKYRAQRKGIVNIQRGIRKWLRQMELKRLQQEQEEEVKRKAVIDQQRTRKARESLRWKLQQQAQASVQKMEEQLHMPNKEIDSAVVIQRAYRKSITRRKKKRHPVNARARHLQASDGHVYEKRVPFNDNREQKDLNLKTKAPKPALQTSLPKSSPLQLPLSQSQPGRLLPDFSRIVRREHSPWSRHSDTQYSPIRQREWGVVKNQQKFDQAQERSHPTESVLSRQREQVPSRHREQVPSKHYSDHIGHRNEVGERREFKQRSAEVSIAVVPDGMGDVNSGVRHPPPPPIVTPGGSSNSIRNVRAMFEQMSRRAADIRRLSSDEIKIIGHQRVKVKHRKNKPDSVIQRLLDRFDPLMLNSANIH